MPSVQLWKQIEMFFMVCVCVCMCDSNKLLVMLMIEYLLTHFMPLVSFDTSWKQQKTKNFLMFSGGIERDSGMK